MLGTLAALIPTTNLWTSYSAVAAVLATIALLVSGGFVITAQYPRLEGPRGSLVYFEGIASNESDDYVNRILESDPKEILRDFARQCHRNAEIAKTKFGQIRYATICTFISLVPWLVAVSLLYHARLAAKGL